MTTRAPSAGEAAGLFSLVRINVRRAMRLGRIYLIVGSALSLLSVGLVAAFGGHGATPGILVGSIVPSEIPIFGLVGSIGAVLVFVSDKSKGVYEYLIAYGVDTSVISASIVLASLVLVSIVMTVAAGVSAAIILARVGSVPWYYVQDVFVDAVPLAFSATAFMTTASMLWAAIASPRSGTNGPVGFAPTIGIGPLVLVLVATGLVPPDFRMWLAPVAALALSGVVVVLAFLLSRGPVRERFLSTL